MQLKILFFASCRDVANSDYYQFSDESVTKFDTLDLINFLRQEIFSENEIVLENISIAVNKIYIRNVVQLNDGDEIAILPPISGG